jgi:hypothetical protein
MSNQSPIFIKTESFMKWLLEHTAKFPKHERFRLAKRIDDAFFDFHVCLVLATDDKTPKALLLKADSFLNLLRAYFRLSVELHYTSPQQYQYIAENTSEIGKLLGGWLKKA